MRFKRYRFIFQAITKFPFFNIALHSYGFSEAAEETILSKVVEVDAVGLTVSDMDCSIKFYSNVLKFKKSSDVEVAGPEYERLDGLFCLRKRVVRMRLNDESIILTEYLTPKGRPAPVDARSNDRWFQHIAIIVSDMDKSYAWLQKNEVEPSSPSPQRLPDWNPNAGGISAFYFKDLDGHPLEILNFPEGKGDKKWHRKTDDLFLGIDHTAIVVKNSEESYRFYRDILGFKVVGESVNYGIEQERLNNVPGVRLRISGLRVESGPAIEFLEYMTPQDGRPMPLDEKVNDLIHWQTTLVVGDIESMTEKLEEAGYSFVSTGAIKLPDDNLGFQKGLLVRDPDGHVMQVVEKFNLVLKDNIQVLGILV